MSAFQLAQLNIAKMRAPLSDPLMAAFVAQLDALNALADGSPGFVWRLQEHLLPDEEREAARQAYGGNFVVNLSVWESVEALQQYVYQGAHGGILRDRRDWFEKLEERWVALWWVPAGQRPTVAAAKERLEYLRAHGESRFAFNFKKAFAAPIDTAP